MSYQIVDTATGKAVVVVIDMQEERYWGECSMCEQYRRLDHAVAWYCGPTHDEIGSVTTEYTDGGIVGGMCVCKQCHDGHYAEPKP
jgi:hypothetical protein